MKKLMCVLSEGKNKAYAAYMSFALALMVPVMAHAADGLSGSMGTKVSEIVADVVAGSVLILGIVGAVVAAKVIFGLFKKA